MADTLQHALVKHGIINAGWQVVAMQNIPVVLPVDRDDLILRRLPYVGRQAGMGLPPFIPIACRNAA